MLREKSNDPAQRKTELKDFLVGSRTHFSALCKELRIDLYTLSMQHWQHWQAIGGQLPSLQPIFTGHTRTCLLFEA